MATVAVEDVHFAAVAGGKDDVVERETHRRELYPTNTGIMGVCDIEAAVCSRRDPKRISELGLGRRTTVATEARGTIPRQGGDNTIRSYLANTVVVGINDVKATLRAYSDPDREIQLGLDRRTAIAAIARSPVS